MISALVKLHLKVCNFGERIELCKADSFSRDICSTIPGAGGFQLDRFMNFLDWNGWLYPWNCTHPMSHHVQNSAHTMCISIVQCVKKHADSF